MIKNDSPDGVFGLELRWERSVRYLYNDVFEYDEFQLLAAHTFAYLFEFREAKAVPKEALRVLLRMKEFSCIPEEKSGERKAAQLVAKELCRQTESYWVQIDGEYDENRFVVCFDEHRYGIVDANTFDLAPLM